MGKVKIKVDPDVAQRLSVFINSNCFSIQYGHAKSEYWKYHANQLSSNVNGNAVNVDGESGFYVPETSSVLQRISHKILRALKHPSKAINWLNRLIMARVGIPRLMSYEKAFDAVMSHAEVSDPDLSRFRINHLKMAKLKNVFTSAKIISRHYQSWSGYAASASIINHYYYQNILRGYVGKNKVSTVMEIGAGNGNFPSILFHDWDPIRVILIDLPETLAVSIPFISSLFPQAKLIMPHEIHSGALADHFDFAFLTVDQLNLVADNSVDLSINCHSFQEMTHEQINIYFNLIQRVTRESGFFFTANRVDKIPSGPDAYRVEQVDPPNRFAEYPWNQRNEILAYEISRLGRLVQLDDIYLRLECIHK